MNLYKTGKILQTSGKNITEIVAWVKTIAFRWAMLFLSSLDCAESIKAKEKKKRNPNKHNTKIKPQNKKPSKTEIHWRQIYSTLKRMGKKIPHMTSKSQIIQWTAAKTFTHQRDEGRIRPGKELCSGNNIRRPLFLQSQAFVNKSYS